MFHARGNVRAQSAEQTRHGHHALLSARFSPAFLIVHPAGFILHRRWLQW